MSFGTLDYILLIRLTIYRYVPVRQGDYLDPCGLYLMTILPDL